uniref:Putative secreted protein n=1 Tax=Panstrongylus lignarius TaxID=156445 RepID=A0A224Y0E8_9HEMI
MTVPTIYLIYICRKIFYVWYNPVVYMFWLPQIQHVSALLNCSLPFHLQYHPFPLQTVIYDHLISPHTHHQTHHD